MLFGTLVEVRIQNARSLLNQVHIPHMLAHPLEGMVHTVSSRAVRHLLFFRLCGSANSIGMTGYYIQVFMHGTADRRTTMFFRQLCFILMVDCA